MLGEKQNGSDVGEEQLRRKESAAVNLGTSAGHGILGEHMWAWDKGIVVLPRCRGDRRARTRDAATVLQGQCDDLWLEDSMRPRGLREAKSGV